MKKLNVAIIGQGRSGRDIHGAYFLSEANTLFNVVAIVDQIEFRRERARKDFGCDVYSDYKDLFNRSDLDIVINSTFSHEHYPITMDLLKHGLNVVVEKPFSAHAEECQNMIDAAKENHAMLTVFQQSHFAPAYKRVKEIINSGVLGEIKQISVAFSGFSRRWDWQCSQRFYGGSLRNTGPHPMEQVLDLMDIDYNQLPETIVSRLGQANTFGDAEDYVKILLMHPGRPVFDVEINSCDAYSDYNYKVQGTRGGIKSTLTHLQYKYFKEEEAPEQKLILEPLSHEDGSPAYCGEQLKWYEFDEDLSGSAFTSAVDEYYTMVYNHLVNGGELVITPEKIKQEIALMEKIHEENPLPVKF